ncbi:hypothetical protein CLAVI_000898 [Candidatus Clavichlamydia salmonicola]|nr:hypothetical protein [Candidatus Clavichlamydia salmonicola]
MIEEEESLLLIPLQTSLLEPLKIELHLTRLAQHLRTASLNNYSLINASISTSDVETDSDTASLQSIQNLKDLVLRLNNWITHQHCIISTSHELSFYQKMQESLNTTATLLHSIPQQNRLENTPEPTPSTSQPFKGVKKRFLALMEQESSLQITHSKAKKSKTDNYNEPTANSLSPLEERPSPLITYPVTKIFFLQEGVFSLEKTEVEDLERFFMENHEMVGQIITLNDHVFAPSKEAISILKYEEVAALRILSLKMLLDFMQQHLMLIHQIPNEDIKKEICKAHFILMNDLRFVIAETEPSTTTSSLLNKAVALPKSMPRDAYLPSYPYIGLKISSSSFFIFAKKTFATNGKFCLFLQQILLAIPLYSYKSSGIIPSIPKSTLNNPLIALQSLYHITSRNYFMFCQIHAASQNVHDQAKNTLNTLNKQYCSIISVPDNAADHHVDLQNLAVSGTNPPLPISNPDTLSYISIYLSNHHSDLWFIQTAIFNKPHPESKTSITSWLNGLKNHHLRIKKLLKQAKNKPIFLICNDNSWPIQSSRDHPIQKEVLTNTLLNIVQHNNTTCLDFFTDYSNDEPTCRSGYLETKITLTKILKTVKNAIDPHADDNDISDSDLSPPASLEINLNTLQTRSIFPVFSLLKPRNYKMEISYLSHHIKFNSLRASARASKKIKKYISTLLASFRPHAIQYQHEFITNIKMVIPLLYWGIQINYKILECTFKNSFIKQNDNASEQLYIKTLADFKISLEELEKNWENISPKQPIPSLHELDHPIRKELSLIIQAFNI